MTLFFLLSHGRLLRIKGPYRSYQVFQNVYFTRSYSPVLPPSLLATAPNQNRLLFSLQCLLKPPLGLAIPVLILQTPHGCLQELPLKAK